MLYYASRTFLILFIGEPRVVLIGEKGGSVQTKMVDQNDRTYKIEFTAPVAGLYNANVQFASSPVPKSPFRITAQAAVNIKQVFVKDLPECKGIMFLVDIDIRLFCRCSCNCEEVNIIS